jgi:transposase InsO family protein
VAGITVHTLQRWKADAGLSVRDGRPHAVRPMPSHALTQAERERVLQVANEARFADLASAREWVTMFVRWFNREHRHSGIGYVTPAQRCWRGSVDPGGAACAVHAGTQGQSSALVTSYARLVDAGPGHAQP